MQEKKNIGVNFAQTLYGRRSDYKDLYIMVAAYNEDKKIAQDFCQTLDNWGIDYELCLYQSSPFKPVHELLGKTPSELVMIHDQLSADTIDSLFEDITHSLKANTKDLEDQWRVNICTTSRNFYKDFRLLLNKETLLDKVRQHTLISSVNFA